MCNHSCVFSPSSLTTHSWTDYQQPNPNVLPTTPPRPSNRSKRFSKLGEETKWQNDAQRARKRVEQTDAGFRAKNGAKASVVVSVPATSSFSLANGKHQTRTGWSGQSMNCADRRRFERWVKNGTAIGRMLKLGFLFLPYECAMSFYCSWP
jgi:hypothetical protein